jgi:hypothetical protein
MSADSAPPFARILNAGKGNEDGEEERRGSGHCTFVSFSVLFASILF